MSQRNRPQALIFDLDGVIMRGQTVIPQAPQVLRALAENGFRAYFLTNNSTRTRADYLALLSAVGIPCSEEQVMTSAYATALYMSEHGWGGKAVFVIGERGLHEELRLAGMRPTEARDFREAQAVVVGLDRQFDYEALRSAQQAILAGAEFIASNGDDTYPTETGIVPGAGSIVAAVAAAAGKEPLVIGKPNTFMLERLLAQAGCPAECAVLVGDRLDTDIELGRRVGMVTVLVLTGVTDRVRAESAPPGQRPDVIIEDLSQLLSFLES
jgi:phosphoglycolate/pyridoxal phosphate phosphatase family enzyme